MITSEKQGHPLISNVFFNLSEAKKNKNSAKRTKKQTDGFEASSTGQGEPQGPQREALDLEAFALLLEIDLRLGRREVFLDRLRGVLGNPKSSTTKH